MASPLNAERLVVGMALIAIGVLWTLSNLGWLDLLSTLRTWWPLALVVWGVLEIYNWLVARQARRSS